MRDEEKDREVFEEKAFAKRFLASIGRNQKKPANAPSGCMDFVSMNCPTKAEFVKRDANGNYEDKTLAAMWWAYILALRSERERASWKPIESAPKDGTEILLTYEANAGIRATLGRWKDQTASLHSQRNQWVVDIGPVPALHWMPLPSPPTPDKESKR
jgi:hypothetical protein